MNQYKISQKKKMALWHKSLYNVHTITFTLSLLRQPKEMARMKLKCEFNNIHY